MKAVSIKCKEKICLNLSSKMNRIVVICNHRYANKGTLILLQIRDLNTIYKNKISILLLLKTQL